MSVCWFRLPAENEQRLATNSRVNFIVDLQRDLAAPIPDTAGVSRGLDASVQ